MDDKQLLQACIERSEEGWKELLQRYSRLVYGGLIATFKRYGQAPQMERVEETFCDFVEHLVAADCRVLRSFRGDNGCSLGSWLRVLAVNYAVDTLRARAGRDRSREVPLTEAVAADLHAGEAGSPEHSLGQAEAKAVMKECLKDLTAKEKLFVRLYYYDGVDVPRISRLLRLTESGVYALKGRLTKKLQERYRARTSA